MASNCESGAGLGWRLEARRVPDRFSNVARLVIWRKVSAEEDLGIPRLGEGGEGNMLTTAFPEICN